MSTFCPPLSALFERLVELGFKPRSIVIAPKIYSTISGARAKLRKLGCQIVEPKDLRFMPGCYDKYAVNSLGLAVEKTLELASSRNAKRCILVDDGGILTGIWARHSSQFPSLDAVSVQQTASGLYRYRLNTPAYRINVASSAAKTYFEFKIIVDGALRKVLSLHLLNKAHSVSIIGLGALGSRLAHTLIRRGHHVSAYDTRPTKYIEDVVLKVELAGVLKVLRHHIWLHRKELYAFRCGGYA